MTALRGYFTMGVEGNLEWPSKEQIVVFRNHKILLRPETDRLARSLVLEMEAGMTHIEARQLLQELLSGLCWVRRGGIMETCSISCSISPGGIEKGNFRAISDAPLEYIPAPSSEKARLALALYREATSVNMISYKFLGFFKVINVLHGTKDSQIGWIEQNLTKITEQPAVNRIHEMNIQNGELARYLYIQGRCAVAHAYAEPIVNPDAPEDLDRLVRDLPVIRALAELAMEQELGVKSHFTVLQEHLYELEGFRDIFGSEVVHRLKREGMVPNVDLRMPDHLSLRIHGKNHLESFEAMLASFRCLGNGAVELTVKTTDNRLKAVLHLCFKQERLVFDATSGLTFCDDGSVEAAERLLDARLLFNYWVTNGVTEV